MEVAAGKKEPVSVEKNTTYAPVKFEVYGDMY